MTLLYNDERQDYSRIKIQIQNRHQLNQKDWKTNKVKKSINRS